MKRIILTLAALLISTAGAFAADKSDPAAAAKAIAPYLDEQTILVGHADLSRVDTDAVFDLLARHFRAANRAAAGIPPDAEDDIQEGLDQGRTMAKSWLNQIKSFGVRDVYVVVTLTNVFDKDIAFGVLTLDENSKPQQLLAALGMLWGDNGGEKEEVRFEQIGQAIVFGPKVTRERLKKLKAPERPELAKAFAAAGDTALQIALIPSADSRRALEELLPTLPHELGGGPSSSLTRGALWTSLGLNLPPKASLTIVAQSDSEPSAKALLATVNAVVKFVATSAELEDKRITPLLQPFLKAFNPAVSGDRVTLNWDQDQVDKVLTQTIVPLIVTARREAQQTFAMSQVRQIVVACIQYQEEHKGQAADTLQQVIDDQHLPPQVLVNPHQPAERKIGFAYRKPPTAADPQWVLIYEIVDHWSGSAVVGFGDCHVETINDEAQFRKLTAPPAAAPK